MQSLETFFSQIPDPRKKGGLRHPLVPVLMMCTFSIMSGYSSNNKIAKFMRYNAEEFKQLFKLKHPPLGHTQLGTILSGLDDKKIVTAFNEWSKQFHAILEPHAGLAGDGKSMNATVTNGKNSNQNFKAVVSFFSHEYQLVHAMTTYENGKKSEIPCVKDLLKHLQGLGVIITLDALHCQKKL